MFEQIARPQRQLINSGASHCESYSIAKCREKYAFSRNPSVASMLAALDLQSPRQALVRMIDQTLPPLLFDGAFPPPFADPQVFSSRESPFRPRSRCALNEVICWSSCVRHDLINLPS
jgi:hypothetical protein